MDDRLVTMQVGPKFAGRWSKDSMLSSFGIPPVKRGSSRSAWHSTEGPIAASWCMMSTIQRVSIPWTAGETSS